jgi:hypothetical protein
MVVRVARNNYFPKKFQKSRPERKKKIRVEKTLATGMLKIKNILLFLHAGASG